MVQKYMYASAHDAVNNGSLSHSASLRGRHRWRISGTRPAVSYKYIHTTIILCMALIMQAQEITIMTYRSLLHCFFCFPPRSTRSCACTSTNRAYGGGRGGSFVDITTNPCDVKILAINIQHESLRPVRTGVNWIELV